MNDKRSEHTGGAAEEMHVTQELVSGFIIAKIGWWMMMLVPARLNNLVLRNAVVRADVAL